MRHSTSRSAMVGVFFLAVAGCQLFTGSYNSDTSSIGPICTSVALCCPALTGTQATECNSYVVLQNEQVCAAFLGMFPGGSCLNAQHDAGTINFDSGTHPDAKSADVGTDGTSPLDTGSSDPLEGSWTLSEAECEGAPVTLSGTVTMTFSGTMVEQTEEFTTGCVQTFILNPATVTSTDIESSSGTVTCSSACTSTECTAGATSGLDVPYTLTSASSFSYTETVPTTSCAAGSETYVWSRNN